MKHIGIYFLLLAVGNSAHCALTQDKKEEPELTWTRSSVRAITRPARVAPAGSTLSTLPISRPLVAEPNPEQRLEIINQEMQQLDKQINEHQTLEWKSAIGSEADKAGRKRQIELDTPAYKKALARLETLKKEKRELEEIVKIVSQLAKPVTAVDKSTERIAKTEITDLSKCCAQCYKIDCSGYCAKCKTVYYCTQECQRAHWPLHKLTCGQEPMPEPLGQSKIATKTDQMANGQRQKADAVSASSEKNRRNFPQKIAATHQKKRKENPRDFYEAVKRNNIKFADIYLTKNPDLINKLNSKGHLALCLAASHDNYEMVTFLLKRSANVNAQDKKGKTALHWAAEFGYFDCVILLLENQAEVDIRTENGKTALNLATYNGHTEVVNIIIRHIL